MSMLNKWSKIKDYIMLFSGTIGLTLSFYCLFNGYRQWYVYLIAGSQVVVYVYYALKIFYHALIIYAQNNKDGFEGYFNEHPDTCPFLIECGTYLKEECYTNLKRECTVFIERTEEEIRKAWM